MPRGDRTGPIGLGPRSGRGAGYCGGAGVPGFTSRPTGAGFGAGPGRGWRHWFWATGLPGWLRFGAQPGQVSTDEPANVEKEMLARQMDALQRELDFVKQRLDQLTSEKTTQQ